MCGLRPAACARLTAIDGPHEHQSVPFDVESGRASLDLKPQYSSLPETQSTNATAAQIAIKASDPLPGTRTVGGAQGGLVLRSGGGLQQPRDLLGAQDHPNLARSRTKARVHFKGLIH
jgi:hypothetical protein